MGNFESVTVIDVLVKPGDTIDIDTPLVTLETDKATMDVPSTAKGVVEKVHVTKGGTVSTGALVVTVKASQTAAGGYAGRGARHRLLPRPPRRPRRPAPAAAPAPAATSSIEVRVPDMGSFDSVAVIEVLVKPGDTVDFDSPLVTLETDKATMDVPSTAKGVVEKVHVAKGGKLSPGAVVVTVKGFAAAAAAAGSSGRAAPPASRPRRRPHRVRPRRKACRSHCRRAAAAAPSTKPSFGTAHASPSVRKFARELGVNLGSVRGSGEKGRILLDDVKAFVKLVMSGGVGARGAPAPALPKAHNYDPRGVRRSRDQAAQPRAEDLGSAPAGRVDQHPARHAVRRVGHHRARSRCAAR